MPSPNELGLTRRAWLTSAAAAAAWAVVPPHLRAVSTTAATTKAVDPLPPLDRLAARGDPAVYRGTDLDFIGMPVGGIGAGQVYVGGDGRLWLWDVFNHQQEGIVAKTIEYGGRKVRARDGANYVEPPRQIHPFEQNFAVRVVGEPTGRRLDATGWSDVRFAGQYPIAVVNYADATDARLTVQLEAFSPFIPLSVDDSSLPVTVMRYTVTNRSAGPLDVELAGWMQNAVLRRATPGSATLRNIDRSDAAMGCVELLATTEDLKVGARPDFGSMSIGVAGRQPTDRIVHLRSAHAPETDVFSATTGGPAECAAGGTLLSAVIRPFALAAGASATASFLVGWHFPNLTLRGLPDHGRHYADRYASAHAAVADVVARLDVLYAQTRLWRDTWYDSTLPHWFLDRTMASTATLATSTCFRLSGGRFYAWEGVGACPGTCTHVWSYAQGAARLFPDLERQTRARVDLGLAQSASTGVIGFRAEFGRSLAVDGQAGTLLRIYREHLCSEDDGFLRDHWDRVKLAFEPLFKLDPSGSGLLGGAQANTLDAAWYGHVAWLSGLYQAAVAAGAAMAQRMGDAAFEGRCAGILRNGADALVRALFNGQYFQNRLDPARPDDINSGSGCEIDQVLGQSWAWQVGLGRVLPAGPTRAALASLVANNFKADVGPYRADHPAGRWYAMPGEAGMIMCTFPRPDWDLRRAAGKGASAWAVEYFDECMTGFEHQVAGHLIFEGMVREGLAVIRAVHDRYHPSKRNPYNEVECSDHYARSMASYGAFIAACGFEYDGPAGRIAFSPRINAAEFRCPFTAARGWGTYAQSEATSSVDLQLKWGALRLQRIGVAAGPITAAASVAVELNGVRIPASTRLTGSHCDVCFDRPLVLAAGDRLHAQFGRG